MTTEVYRLNIVLDRTSYEALKKLAQRRQTTMVGAIRESLAFDLWAIELIDRGGKLLAEEDSALREIIRPIL